MRLLRQIALRRYQNVYWSEISVQRAVQHIQSEDDPVSRGRTALTYHDVCARFAAQKVLYGGQRPTQETIAATKAVREAFSLETFAKLCDVVGLDPAAVLEDDMRRREASERLHAETRERLARSKETTSEDDEREKQFRELQAAENAKRADAFMKDPANAAWRKRHELRNRGTNRT